MTTVVPFSPNMVYSGLENVPNQEGCGAVKVRVSTNKLDKLIPICDVLMV